MLSWSKVTLQWTHSQSNFIHKPNTHMLNYRQPLQNLHLQTNLNLSFLQVQKLHALGKINVHRFKQVQDLEIKSSNNFLCSKKVFTHQIFSPNGYKRSPPHPSRVRKMKTIHSKKKLRKVNIIQRRQTHIESHAPGAKQSQVYKQISLCTYDHIIIRIYTNLKSHNKLQSISIVVSIYIYYTTNSNRNIEYQISYPKYKIELD